MDTEQPETVNPLVFYHTFTTDGVKKADVEPSIRIDEWNELFNEEVRIFYQVVHLKDSYYVWTGTFERSLHDLHLAIKTRFVCRFALCKIEINILWTESHPFCHISFTC